MLSMCGPKVNVLSNVTPRVFNLSDRVMLLPRVADVPSRGRLRSSSTDQLLVRRARLTTIGDRTFAVAGSRLWNSLPADVTTSSSLTVFRRRLKTFLFKQSYPNLT